MAAYNKKKGCGKEMFKGIVKFFAKQIFVR